MSAETKRLLTVLTLAATLIGIAGGMVGGSWALDDRIDRRIDRALEPIKGDVAEIKGLLLRYLVPPAARPYGR